MTLDSLSGYESRCTIGRHVKGTKTAFVSLQDPIDSEQTNNLAVLDFVNI